MNPDTEAQDYAKQAEALAAQIPGLSPDQPRHAFGRIAVKM